MKYQFSFAQKWSFARSAMCSVKACLSLSLVLAALWCHVRPLIRTTVPECRVSGAIGCKHFYKWFIMVQVA